MTKPGSSMEDYPKLAAVVVLILCVLGAAMRPANAQQPNAIQEVVFENVFTSITTAQQSQPLRNIGQAMHTVQVTFPLENTEVTSIQVRLEWTRDGSDWRPAGPDITTAPVLSEGIGATDVIAYETYYGVFRAIRVNNVIDTPGAEQMTVKYIGHIIPVVPFVTLQGDRWAF